MSLFSGKARAPHSTLSPIFVVGVGRSGTSLVQSVLNAHPQIAVSPETHFIRKYALPDKNLGVAELLELLEADEDFSRGGISASDVLKPFLEDASKKPSPALVYERYLSLYQEKEGKPVVGDKDPRLIDSLPSLQRMFPSAYVLHVVRDPRDVVLSRMKAAWSSGRPWWQHALVSAAQFRLGRKDGQRRYRDRYMEVRYEDVLSRPEEEFARICKWMGVAFAPEMLDFSAAAEKLVDQRELSWKQETLGPLLRKNTGKWKAELEPSQACLIEEVCREAMNTGPYLRSPRDQIRYKSGRHVLCSCLRLLAFLGYPVMRRLHG